MRNKSKKVANLLAVISALQFVSPAHAFNYTNGDALLVFRSVGLDDVEFDLGNVSQFLNHTNGYTFAVTNWSAAVVSSNYALNGGNVQFAVLATTSIADPNPASWVSDAQPLVAAPDVTPSKWSSGLAGIISAVGNGAQNDPLTPANVNYDVLIPASKYAFDYIASNNGNSPGEIPYLGGGGGIQFQVTGAAPGAALFYQISPTSVTPKPPGTLIGSFTLNTNAVLTFQAGPLLDAATITSVSDPAGTVAVTFNSKAAVKYCLRYSTNLALPLSSWTILTNSVAGSGNPQVLYDATATDNSRFYTVESYP